MEREYTEWLQSLSDEDLENESYTVRVEGIQIGMSNDEIIDRSNALTDEAFRRQVVRG
jgi:hypothetical protein